MTQMGTLPAGLAPAGVRDADGALVIGAATRVDEIALLPLVGRRLPVLAEATRMAAPALGGEPVGAVLAARPRDLGHRALVLALMVLDARLVGAADDGGRELGAGELPDDAPDPAPVLELRVPDLPARAGGAVEHADDGRLVAVQIFLGEALVARSARVAVAGPERAPVRVPAVERALMGRHPDAAVAEAAAARLGGDPAVVACARRAIARAVERALAG